MLDLCCIDSLYNQKYLERIDFKMTDLVYDFITTGVDLLLIGAVLSAMIVMMRGSTQLTQLISAQQVTTEEFDVYLKYHMYDNQDHLATADAISALVGYRYDLNIGIKVGDTYYCNDPDTGRYYKFTDSDSDITNGPYLNKTSSELRANFIEANRVSYDDIVNEINSTNLYHSDLIVMDNGKLGKESFSRDTIVIGILLEKNN